MSIENVLFYEGMALRFMALAYLVSLLTTRDGPAKN